MNPLATLSNKEFVTAISVVLAITVAAVGYFKTSAQRQAPDPKVDRAYERLIEKRTNSAISNEPVAITLAKTKKRVVEFGKAFKDDDNDWLKGFTLTAQNNSQKAITYIELTYSFERAKDDANRDQPVLVDTLTYGSRANRSNQMRLNPGESTDLVLTDETHDFLKKALAQAGYPPSIKHIRFYLSQVNFEDGTMWSLGYWIKRIRLTRRRSERYFVEESHSPSNSLRGSSGRQIEKVISLSNRSSSRSKVILRFVDC